MREQSYSVHKKQRGINTMKLAVVLCGLSSVCAFIGTTPTFRKPSQVYLEDRIAEM